jgi:hypothetical protein
MSSKKNHRMMSGGKAVVESLKIEGVRCVFGLIGSATMEIFDALYKNKKSPLLQIQLGQIHSALLQFLKIQQQPSHQTSSGGFFWNSLRCLFYICFILIFKMGNYFFIKHFNASHTIFMFYTWKI